MFFHVSIKDFGSKFKFIPKLPASALISKEGNIPRICVSNSIFNCLRSIVGSKHLYAMDLIQMLEEDETNNIIPFTIYSTNKEPYLPPHTHDFRRNHEHWFIKSVMMERIGYVDTLSLLSGKVLLNKEFITLPKTKIKGYEKIKKKEGLDVHIKNIYPNRSIIFLEN